MKRIASLFLCALIVLTSCVLFAIPASAAEKVVYVSDGATGDGSSASAPLGTLEAAINALAATGGTIKIVGTVTLTANATTTNDAALGYFKAPACDRQITITSNDNINKSRLVWTDDCQWYALGGPTVFENLKMVDGLTDGISRILAMGNHLTLGEGLEMYFGENLQDVSTILAAFKGFSIVGLCSAGAEYDGFLADDSWITIKSGVYASIIGKTHNVNTAAGELTGNTYFEFLGDFAVREMGSTSWSGADQIHDVGQAYVVFDAKVSAWRYFPGYNYVGQIPFTCNFFVLGGAYVDANGAPLALVGAAKVQILNIWSDDSNPEAYDLGSQFMGYSITQAGGATNIDDIKNYTGPAYRLTEDVAPLDADATVPVVTEPVVTTEAAADTTEATVTTEAAGEVTPPTGDASLMLVFAAAAVLCVGAVVVIKKQER